MSDVANPNPVEADDGIIGYECPECGTMKKTEEQAREHCTDAELDSEPAASESEDADGSGLSQDDVREHHQRIRDAVEPIGALGGNPTLLVNDKTGWYVTRENTDPSDDELGEYPKVRRARNFATDYDDVVADRLDRTLYALTSYKRPQAFERWEPARFDREEGGYEYLNEKPSPNHRDTAAIAAWGDVDLADELKPERDALDEDTYATVEAALEAYIDAFADLYGGRDAVYALDSVGGAYVFGAPEATLPISRHYEDDEDARERVFGAFIDRTNEYLQDAEGRVNEAVDRASETVHPDWANNLNRQYKMPLTIHGDHDAVVMPLDVEDVRYREPVGIESVDDALLEDVREWTEAFTAVDHTDRVDGIVATLWPDEYEEHGSWDDALDAWVETQREAERAQEQRREAAAQRREERMEELGGDLEGQPITPFMQDVYDALDGIDTTDVVRNYASDSWDTGANGTDKTEFDPSWRESSSGSSCYVDHTTNRFGDAGQQGGGYAAKAMALGEGIIRDASADLSGQDWGEAVAALRDAGYDVPIWTPEAGSKDPSGNEYDEMPFWAVKKAAVALGVLPEDGFSTKTSDDGSEYLGFPGPQTYNNALDAISEAGLEHGREYTDTGPLHPTYQMMGDEKPDLELYLRPVSGKSVEVQIMRDGEEAYAEVLDRGFWNSGTKRSRVAGRIKDEIQAVDKDELAEEVKSVLVQVVSDSKEDWFEDAMRSESERELRNRTMSVVCWPGTEEAEWAITMRPPTSSPETEPQTFTLDNGQIVNADPGHFRSLHTGAFFEKVEIDAEEWSNITTYWLDIQETKAREADPRTEAAIEEFLSKIESMTVHAVEDGFSWDSRNGLYERDHSDGQDAILVPGRWIQNWKNDSDYGELNLSKILRERGIMLQAAGKRQIAGRQNRVWPIAASETMHTYENSHRPLDEDDEDAPEGLV